MKANINIKPIYIVAFALIIFGLISTKLIINSNNNNKNDLALIVEQNTIEVQKIIQENNNITQTKLDGLASGLDGLASGVSTLNENDIIIAAKIDVITVELGLLKEDVALIGEGLTLIGETLENNQNAILIELEGLKSTVNILKSQGYNQVTPKQVIDYSKCVAASTSPTTCAQILN